MVHDTALAPALLLHTTTASQFLLFCRQQLLLQLLPAPLLAHCELSHFFSRQLCTAAVAGHNVMPGRIQCCVEIGIAVAYISWLAFFLLCTLRCSVCLAAENGCICFY